MAQRTIPAEVMAKPDRKKEIINKLKAQAAKLDPGLEWKAENAKWVNGDHEEWCKQIPDALKRIWEWLPLEARLAAAITAYDAVPYEYFCKTHQMVLVLENNSRRCSRSEDLKVGASEFDQLNTYVGQFGERWENVGRVKRWAGILPF